MYYMQFLYEPITRDTTQTYNQFCIWPKSSNTIESYWRIQIAVTAPRKSRQKFQGKREEYNEW